MQLFGEDCQRVRSKLVVMIKKQEWKAEAIQCECKSNFSFVQRPIVVMIFCMSNFLQIIIWRVKREERTAEKQNL